MIVLDCSAAVNMVMHSEEGDALLMLMKPDEAIIAPSLYQAEATSTFWKLAQFGNIQQNTAGQYINEALSLVNEFVDMADLCTEALLEGLHLKHSPYDLFYLVLARRTGSTLFTIDNKLASLAEQCGVDCIHTVHL